MDTEIASFADRRAQLALWLARGFIAVALCAPAGLWMSTLGPSPPDLAVGENRPLAMRTVGGGEAGALLTVRHKLEDQARIVQSSLGGSTPAMQGDDMMAGAGAAAGTLAAGLAAKNADASDRKEARARTTRTRSQAAASDGGGRKAYSETRRRPSLVEKGLRRVASGARRLFSWKR